MTGQDTTDFPTRWTEHLRKNAKIQVYPCPFCVEHDPFLTEPSRWTHIMGIHCKEIPSNEDELQHYRKSLPTRSESKKPTRPDPSRQRSQGKRQLPTSSTKLKTEPIDPQSSRLETPDVHSGSHSVLLLEQEKSSASQPRKRAALDDGGSPSSSLRVRDSKSPPPSKQRPTSSQSGRNFPPPERGVASNDVPDPTARPATNGPKKLYDPSTGSFSRNEPLAKTKTRPQARTGQQQPQKWDGSGSVSRPTSVPSPRTFPASVLNTKGTEELYKQPKTRPISQEQLVAEVKGIYAGLVMVEAKCIEVDDKQAAQSSEPGAPPALNNDQWQALIALHRTLLHEHHDFFLASQHPSASPALKRLASKYAMPARMWRHGIHSFLELLRRRLPASHDHMLAFIYLAYSMMALLYETVPAFEETWIECLGDLGRYRMAIEDDDLKDREVWTGVARHWYSKASDKSPFTGRLYHHIAILARPNQLQQLFYYAKSLSVEQPFLSARESIMTLFDQSLASMKSSQRASPPVKDVQNTSPSDNELPRAYPLDFIFVRLHAMLFTHKKMDDYPSTFNDFTTNLDEHIGRVPRRFMEQGYQMAVANSVALLGFGDKESPLEKALKSAQTVDVEMSGTLENKVDANFRNAQQLHNETIKVVLKRFGDPNILPFLHVTLVFIHHLSYYPSALRLLEASLPWESIAIYLNTLTASSTQNVRVEGTSSFPRREKESVRPFPEDFAMRGLLWTVHYFPEDWFRDLQIDDEERYMEAASMTDERKTRIVWLGIQIANAHGRLVFDQAKQRFSVQGSVLPDSPADFDRASSVELSDVPMAVPAATDPWASHTNLSRESENLVQVS